jgi:hypothetical protein
VNDAAEYQAVDAAFTYLEQFRKQPLGVRGYTHSTARPPSHFGAWWSSQRRRWVRDKLVLCFVDFKVNFNDQELTRILAELKDAIRTAYCQFTGKSQEEYWVVAHHVVR